MKTLIIPLIFSIQLGKQLNKARTSQSGRYFDKCLLTFRMKQEILYERSFLIIDLSAYKSFLLL